MGRKRKLSSIEEDSDGKRKRFAKNIDEALEISFPRKTRGAENLHSTCYIGTVLQSVANQPSLLNVIFRIPTETEVEGTDFAAVIQRSLLSILSKDFSTGATMRDLCKVIKKDPAATGDAGEFLSRLCQNIGERVGDTLLNQEFRRMFPVLQDGSSCYLAILDAAQDSTLEEGLSREYVGAFKDLGELFVVQVNRVHFNRTTLQAERVLSKFDYPPDFSPEFLGFPDSPRYTLEAVIVHLYKESTPHYKIEIRNENTWLTYDDESVRTVKESKVLNAKGGSKLGDDQPLGVLFIYRRQREPADNVVSVPGHVVRSMAKYDAGPEPELILKVADTADLYNKCFDILDQTVNFKTFHVRKEDLKATVVEYVAKGFGCCPSSVEVRRLHSVVDTLQVAQATLSSSLTLKAIKKEMKSMDGLPTFKVLLLSRDSESECPRVAVKVFKQEQFWSLGLYPASSTLLQLQARIQSEHDLRRLRSSVLREGRSVSHLKPEEEVSSSLLNLATTVVPVILMEEEGSAQMVPYVERQLKKIPISLRERSTGKAEIYGVLYVDMSKDEAIDAIGGIVKHPADMIQLASFDGEGKTVPPLRCSDPLTPLLAAMHQNTIPRMLTFTRLDTKLEVYEQFDKLKIRVIRMDETSEPLTVVKTPSLLTLQDVKSKVLMEIPDDSDGEVRWEFVDMQRSTIWGILEERFPLANLNTDTLTAAEVPTAGVLIPFVCHVAGSIHNRLGRPGILDISGLHSVQALIDQLMDLTGLGITAVELVDASMWPEEISCIEEVKEAGQDAATSRPLSFKSIIAATAHVLEN